MFLSRLICIGVALVATGDMVFAAECSFDLNADGIVDMSLQADHRLAPDPPPGWPADRDDDGLLEYSLDREWQDTPPRGTRLFELDLVWDSGTVLSNIWCVEAGDADLDGVFDFAGTHFNPTVIHLFEADGGGGYTEVWNSAGNSPPGSYRDLAFGDTDGDGLGEIFGGELSTLGKVMLFEESGDGFVFVHDTIRESDFTGTRQVRTVLLGDTDRDGRQEVIVATGGSSPTSGLVAIWEHNGVVGDNTYTEVYEYTTNSYLFQVALGDADNDTWPEIVLGLGGFGGNPLIIRRVEYDPGQGTCVHHMFTSDVIGLPATPHVADLDEDGENELAYGSSGEQGFVVVFENTGPNAFAPRFETGGALDGNVLSLASFPMGNTPAMTFAAGSFEGDVGLWSYNVDLDTFEPSAWLLDLGAAVREIAMGDDGVDGIEEVLPALSGGVDQVHVYRRGATIGVGSDRSLFAGVRLSVFPNPAASFARFGAGYSSGVITIHDVRGSLVRRLFVAGGDTRWGLRSTNGLRVSPGVYYARATGERRAGGVRVLVVR